MAARVEELRVPSDGLDLYGRLRTVHRDEPTIVLLPGLGFHTFEYEPLAAWLAGRGCNCVSLDYRGHGRSTGRRGRWDLSDLAADARRAVDVVAERHAGPVVLFGNSLGAMVAIRAGAADRRVGGVIASNAPARIADFLLTPARRLLFAVAKLVGGLPLRMSVEHFYGYGQLIDDPAWLAAIERDPLIADARRLRIGAYRALLEDWDGRRAVAALRRPLLLIQGRNDALQPPDQAEALLAAANEGTELVYVETGHLPHLEDPATVGTVIGTWLVRAGLRPDLSAGSARGSRR